MYGVLGDGGGADNVYPLYEPTVEFLGYYINNKHVTKYKQDGAYATMLHIYSKVRLNLWFKKK